MSSKQTKFSSKINFRPIPYLIALIALSYFTLNHPYLLSTSQSLTATLSHYQLPLSLISECADKYSMGFFFALSTLILSSTSLQLLLCTSCLSVSLNTLLKLLLQLPRPFFLSPIHPIQKCEFEFGWPSGHAQNASTFFLAFFWLGCEELKVVGLRKLGVFSTIFWGLLIVAAARVGVGVHSLDQVIGGIFLGVAVNLVVLGMVRKKVEGVFMAMESGTKGVWNNQIFWIYLCINLAALGMMVPGVEELLIDVPEVWMVNIGKV
jgi:membrane-associated phospholipid phosphatase